MKTNLSVFDAERRAKALKTTKLDWLQAGQPPETNLSVSFLRMERRLQKVSQ